MSLLVAREQFITCCHKELAVFLGERKLKTPKEDVDAAETFLEALWGQMNSVIHTAQAQTPIV